MSCHACNHVGRSYDGKPFAPPGADCHALMFVCSSCGTQWYQYNYHFHLWKEVPASGFHLVITDNDVVLVSADDTGPEFSD